MSLFAATPTRAGAAEQPMTVAGLSVTMWSGDAAAAAPQPTIIFSHGFHGCSTQSRFLMEAFAGAGYLVVAPNHRDASCGGRSSGGGRADVPFQQPDRWNDTGYRERADDIRRLIDAMRADERFRSHADLGHLAPPATRSAATPCWASPARGRAGS